MISSITIPRYSAPSQPSQPSQPAQPAPSQPADSVSIGGKIAELPRKIIEGAAGVVGGVVGVAYHTIPGAVEGLAEGLTSHRGEGGTGWYTLTLLAETMGTGAAVGAAVGGPAGALIGTGIGLVVGGLYRAIEGKADVPQRFVKAVDDKVDAAIANNTEGSKVKIAVQNATQGTIIGVGVGIQEGWKIGKETGSATVGVIMDVAYGVVEGAWEAIRGPKKP